MGNIACQVLLCCRGNRPTDQGAQPTALTTNSPLPLCGPLLHPWLWLWLLAYNLQCSIVFSSMFAVSVSQEQPWACSHLMRKSKMCTCFHYVSICDNLIQCQIFANTSRTELLSLFFLISFEISQIMNLAILMYMYPFSFSHFSPQIYISFP